ncbi:MAG: hypothetical protein KatS3mg110_2568 [Pirellulaceae bacterium]|nr:MAG: hypothetical protein KatS3mg110_2568 [Pirellulaceae bacterium]
MRRGFWWAWLWVLVAVALIGCKPQAPAGSGGSSGGSAPSTSDGNTTSR